MKLWSIKIRESSFRFYLYTSMLIYIFLFTFIPFYTSVKNVIFLLFESLNLWIRRVDKCLFSQRGSYEGIRVTRWSKIFNIHCTLSPSSWWKSYIYGHSNIFFVCFTSKYAFFRLSMARNTEATETKETNLVQKAVLRHFFSIDMLYF